MTVITLTCRKFMSAVFTRSLLQPSTSSPINYHQLCPVLQPQKRQQQHWKNNCSSTYQWLLYILPSIWWNRSLLFSNVRTPTTPTPPPLPPTKPLLTPSSSSKLEKYEEDNDKYHQYGIYRISQDNNIRCREKRSGRVNLHPPYYCTVSVISVLFDDKAFPLPSFTLKISIAANRFVVSNSLM